MTRRARDSPIKSANGTIRSAPNRAVSPYRMIVLTWRHLVFLPGCIVRPQREVEAGEPGEARADRGDRVEERLVAQVR